MLLWTTGCKKIKATEKFLKFVFSTENLQTINTTIYDDLKITWLMKKTGLDFDDTIQYYTTTQTNCKTIITFDKYFKKTKLKIFSPKEIMEQLQNH